jgi:hypothetical protein
MGTRLVRADDIVQFGGSANQRKSLAIAFMVTYQEKSEDVLAVIRVVDATVFAVAWGVWGHLYRPSVQ